MPEKMKESKFQQIKYFIFFVVVFLFQIIFANWSVLLFLRYKMGIHNLAKLIADQAPAAIKEGEMANYFGRKIAIDA